MVSPQTMSVHRCIFLRILTIVLAACLILSQDAYTATRQSDAERNNNLLNRNENIMLKRSHINTQRHSRTDIPRKLRTRFAQRYIIQLTDTIRKEWIALLAGAGVELVSYIPHNAYLIKADDTDSVNWEMFPFVQWAGPYEAFYKLSDEMLVRVTEEDQSELTPADLDTPEFVSLNILFFPGEEEKTIAKIENLLGQVVRQVKKNKISMATIVIPSHHISQLAQLDGVRWIEHEPMLMKHNDLARIVTNVTTTITNHPTLTGKGVVVNVNDTGIDDTHPAFALNPALPTSYPANNTRIRNYSWNTGERGDDNGHGSHVAGSILGSGALSNTIVSSPGSSMPYNAAGMAPEAEVVMFEIFNGGGIDNEKIIEDAYTQGARISSNSWGYNSFFGPLAIYDINAAIWDAGVRDAVDLQNGDQPLCALFAAGNAGGGQSNGLGGYENTVTSPGTAKNVITVGASELLREATNHNNPSMCDNTNQIASFSSRGPVSEGTTGRIKPDIVAPGVYVLSVQSSQLAESPDSSPLSWDFKAGNVDSGPHYQFMSGTSMATPVTTGIATLLYQYYRDQGKIISPALMKALLINGARSLGSLYDFNPQASIIYQGWGGVNLSNSIDGPNGPGDPNDLLVFDQSDLGYLQTGDTASTQVAINVAGNPLRITLVWTDPPGNPSADIILVNDLNLKIIAPDNTVYYGNNFPTGSVWSASDGTPDTVNNVENVYIENAQVGVYQINVMAHSINADACSSTTNIDQDFALVISGDMGFDPQSFGQISINKKTCNVGDFFTITVSDSDLAGAGICTVTASSDTETNEILTLTESGTPGVFNTTVFVEQGSANAGDEKIQVLQREEIIVTYIDADDGSGNLNVPIENSLYSNTPPVFSGIDSLVEEENQIVISWTEANDQESPITYRIYRRKPTDSYDFFRPYAETHETTYTDTLVSATVTYFYLVRALDPNMLIEDNTVELSGSPLDTVAPSFNGLTSIVAENENVRLSWKPAYDPSSPVSYNIYRSLTSGGQDFQTPYDTTNVSKYEDTNVANGTEYFYVVRALDGLGNEDTNTVELSAIPQAPPSDVLFVDITGSNGDGSSWAQAFKNIASAIAAAESSGDHEIWVAKGTYELNSTLVVSDGIRLYGGFEGRENSRDARDVIVNKTIIVNSSFLDGSTVQLAENSQINGFYVSKYYSIFFEGSAMTVIGNNAEIQRCIIYDSKTGIHALSTANNMNVYNNIFLNNEHGIVIEESAAIKNNTFQFTDTAIDIQTSASVEIKNNVFYKCDKCAIADSAGSAALVVDYNNYYENKKNYLNVSPGNHELFEDPIFISEDLDFHLGKGSPCIDAGEPWGNYIDIEGDERIPSTIDIGADETGVSGQPSASAFQAQLLDEPIGMVKITVNVTDPNSNYCRMKMEFQQGLQSPLKGYCAGPTEATLGPAPSVGNQYEFQIGNTNPSIQTVNGTDNQIVFYWDSAKDLRFFVLDNPMTRRTVENRITLLLTVNDGNANSTNTASATVDLINMPRLLPEPEFTLGTTNTLHVMAIPEATQFYYEVSATPSFTTILDQSGWVADTAYTFTNLVPGTQYYYRVKGRIVENTYDYWTQTLLSDFANNTQSNVDTLSTPGSVHLATTTPIVTDVVKNPSFDNDGYSNWTIGSSIYAGASLTIGLDSSWQTEGTNSLRISNAAGDVNYAGEYGYFKQNIDFTHISAIKFDLRHQAIGKTGYHVKGQVIADGQVLWEKAITGEHFDQEIDVSGITGEKTLEFRMRFLNTTNAFSGTDIFNFSFDNIRTIGIEQYVIDNDGIMVTPAIAPSPFSRWDTVTYSLSNINASCNVKVDVLDASDNILLANVLSNTNLHDAGITDTSIKLRATLSSTDASQSPALEEWVVYYVEVENDTTDSEFSQPVTSMQDLDSDNDDMPDQYEAYYNTNPTEPTAIPLDPNVADGSVDGDHDGQTNYFEFITGSDPTDSTDFVDLMPEIHHINGVTTATLKIKTHDLRWYELYYSDFSATPPQWHQLGETVRGKADTEVEFIDTDENLDIPYDKRFYKLKIIRNN